MLAYWILFAVFAIGALFSLGRGPRASVPRAATSAIVQEKGVQAEPRQKALIAAALLAIGLIGFRYNVGTDYGAYENMFRRLSRLSFPRALGEIDVGYAALNWVAGNLGAGLWLVNLVCGALFIYGLIRFAKTQANPWLAVTVAVPYLIITVGMGYSRQAVAIGLCMAGLASASRGSFPKFVAYVLAGALFHRTAVVLIPIVTLAYSRNRLVGITVGILGSIVGYYVLMSGQGYDHFQHLYVNRKYESEGAAVRLAMNLPPALLFLLFWRRFTADRQETITYVIFSLIAFASMVLLFLYPESSAGLDRMALYIIPLQLFVFARLPAAFPNQRGHPSGILVTAVIAYSAAVQLVWLNYASNAISWIPYQLYPLRLFG